MSPTSHRPGVWVQKNKSHKTGSHRSKGEGHVANKGRVAPASLKKGKKHLMNRTERRNQKQQKRSAHMQQTIQEKQKSDGVPLTVIAVPLSEIVSVPRFLELLRTQSDDPSSDFTTGDTRAPVLLKFSKQKLQLSVYDASNNDLFDTMNLLQVADLVIFLHDPFEELSEQHAALLSALTAEGLPPAVHCVFIEIERDQNVQLFLKERSDVKKQVAKRISNWFPDPNLEFVSGEADLPNFMFRLGNTRTLASETKKFRPYMMSTEYTYAADQNLLKVSGILKGGKLDINGIVHIVGHGDFLIKEVHIHPRPGKNSTAGDDLGSLGILHADASQQPSLVPDEEMDEPAPIDMEQDLVSVATKIKKTSKKVAEGTSEYQAAWIVDADEEDVEEESDDENEMDMEDGDGTNSLNEDEMDQDQTMDNVDLESNSGVPDSVNYDARINMEEEQAALNMMKNAKMDRMFPDEIDTPADVPARVKFIKYRGLDDYRNANWEADENLPKEYTHINKFSNLARSKRAAMEKMGKAALDPYTYVTIYLKDVPASVVDAKKPLFLFGLLAHENLMTVVNMSVKRVMEFEEPIPNNEEFIFQMGFRRFRAKAMFSELSAGRLHKMLRFMPTDAHFVISTYAPITYPPAPVLVFREISEGNLSLVATGSVLSLDPDRVVLKRAVLSGHPFKINVRSAVVRFMFFNREDINWFKKIRLTTKHGRVGEIKEPLGTHGHFKARFDGQLQSSDVVLMKLYKRVFPKWSYRPLTGDSEGTESMTE